FERHPRHGRGDAGGANLSQQFGRTRNALGGVVFLDRLAGSDHRQDRVVAMRDRGDMIDRLWAAPTRPEIIGILAHRAFYRGLGVGDVTFDNDLRARGHFEIDRFTAHDLDGSAEIGAHVVDFAYVRWDRHARDERREGRAALKHRERHGLADRFPHAVDLSQMLQGMNDPGHPAAVERMTRATPQLVQLPSGARATTVPQVLMYRPPSPSWISGTGRRSRFAASPVRMFSLQGPVAMRRGLMPGRWRALTSASTISRPPALASRPSESATR